MLADSRCASLTGVRRLFPIVSKLVTDPLARHSYRADADKHQLKNLNLRHNFKGRGALNQAAIAAQQRDDPTRPGLSAKVARRWRIGRLQDPSHRRPEPAKPHQTSCGHRVNEWTAVGGRIRVSVCCRPLGDWRRTCSEAAPVVAGAPCACAGLGHCVAHATARSPCSRRAIPRVVAGSVRVDRRDRDDPLGGGAKQTPGLPSAAGFIRPICPRRRNHFRDHRRDWTR